MARRPPGSVVNRRHVARLEREHQQTNYIKIASIAIIAMVVLLVFSGLIYDRVIVARQPVATVKGEKISTREFQARVKYERNNLVNRYYQTYQTAQQFGADPQFLGFFQNSLNQIELQLAPDSIGRDVINTLIEERILRQKAAEMGITVTEEEIQKKLEELFFGYYGGEQPPTPTEVPTTRPTSTLSALQMTLSAPTAIVTATATITAIGTETAESTPSAEATATPEASPTAEPTTEPTQGPTPTATLPPPTPTPYTADVFDTDYKDTLQNLKRNLGFTETDLRYLIESQILREKLLEVIAADVAIEQDQVWARQILVGDEATANEVLARLQAGEDFAALVTEYSADTATTGTGGDLGWFGVGEKDIEFEKVVFNTEIGKISKPVQTNLGWHIVQVLGHELRPLSASEYDQLRQAKFEEWLTQQRQLFDSEITYLDYWTDRIPSEPTIQPIDLQSALGAPTDGIVTATPALPIP